VSSHEATEVRRRLDATALSRLHLVSLAGIGIALVSIAFDWLYHPELAGVLVVGNICLIGFFSVVRALTVRDRIPSSWASAVGSSMWLAATAQMTWAAALSHFAGYGSFFVLYVVGCGALHLHWRWMLGNLTFALAGWLATGFTVSGRDFLPTAGIAIAGSIVAITIHAVTRHYLTTLAKLNLRDARASKELGEALARASQEIEERKRAEDALREREEELVALSDATEEALFVHKDGRIVATNKAARELYRLPADGAVGRRLLEFVAPEGLEVVNRHIATRSPDPYESVGLRADGTKFPAAVHARSAMFRSQPVRLAAIRDLTETRRLQERLAFSDRLASVGTLAAGVAHEINNPLAFISLNLESVIEKLAAAPPLSVAEIKEALEALQDARTGAVRVQDIVRDLKTFSRADHDPKTRVSLGPVIAYAARMAAAELRHRARVVIELGELPSVLGSETRLGQVFLNLLVNAAQALPPGAADKNVVSVSAEARSENVVVSVSDTGAGIPAEMLGRIFDPFVTTNAHGSGLGLAICHGIVSQLGGTIEVESVVGSGSTFRVTLPVAPLDAVPAEAPPSVPPKVAVTRARVLIIDDEPMLLRVMTRLIEQKHDVVAMLSAELALTALERGEHFDVVLCDLLMPAMTGMDFYAQLVERFPAVAERVVFLSGGVFTRQAQAFMRTMSRPLVDKPFSRESLHGAVEAVLAGAAV